MSDVSNQIKQMLSRGECVQIISLPGMGASRLAKTVGGMHLDANFYPHFSGPQFIDLVNQSSERKLIIIDSLDRFIRIPQPELFFRFLKGLRDQFKYQLKYIFINRSAHPLSPSFQPVLGDLYALISENLLYLPSIPDSEIASAIKQRFLPNLEFSPTPSQIKIITQLSGGIPSLIKITIQSMRDSTNLNPDTHPRLKTQLEEIRLALGENFSLDLLQKHGLLDPQSQIRSKLLKDYLDKYSPPRFSAAETRLFNLLSANLNKIVTKDQICEVVYPDVKNRTGITDHAIDQLIHRLREKISRDYQLITHRGLGFKLVSH